MPEPELCRCFKQSQLAPLFPYVRCCKGVRTTIRPQYGRIIVINHPEGNLMGWEGES